jgi:Raf kinase inhibitor-like YbhB/YbcL family protein
MARGRDRRCRNRAAAALLLALSLLLSGCGLFSGPRPLSADAPLIMEVSSPAAARGVLPRQFTCHGAGVTPPVDWSGAPAHTKSYAVVIDDADAPITPFVYWLVFDIGAATTYTQLGALPPSARVARNSTGQADYDPPCPTSGPHKYRITVYALNTVLGRALPSQPQLLPTWNTLAPHVLARGTTTVTACPVTGPGASVPPCKPPRPHRASK